MTVAILQQLRTTLGNIQHLEGVARENLETLENQMSQLQETINQQEGFIEDLEEQAQNLDQIIDELEDELEQQAVDNAA